MKRYMGWLLCLACLCVSCVDDERDLHQNGDGNGGLDLSFEFAMRSEKVLAVTAKTQIGKPAADVPFNVYLENPYMEGDRLQAVQPVYTGITDKDGRFRANVLIPEGVTTLYVTTTYSGYGPMQVCEVGSEMSVNFAGINPFIIDETTTRSVIRAGSGEITRESKVCYPGQDNSFGLYTFYQKGIYTTLASGLFKDGASVDAELFSAEDVTDISSYANRMFPERVAVTDDKYFSVDYCTDLLVTQPTVGEGETYEGTEVWVTFLGDGGYSADNPNTFNALCYYTYDTAKGVTAGDAATIRKTMIFPNTNVKKLTQVKAPVVGAKVQLMYWDEVRQLYTTVFPAGVSIGWAMLAAEITGGGAGQAMKNLGNYRFSTPQLNDNPAMPYPGAYTNGIGRWCEEGGFNVVGMDCRLYNDPSLHNDRDYNDILIKVESNPMIKPKDEVPVPEEPEYRYSMHGTLAFEDNWPSLGDYDFNDFVTDYTYTLIRNTDAKGQPTNEVLSIELTFTPQALGAMYTSGFGIQLPIATADVDATWMTGGTLEEGNSLATVIVYDDIRKSAFATNVGGYINTVRGGAKAQGVQAKVFIPLRKPIVVGDENLFAGFNPFLFVGDRTKEIHLTDMAPTEKMNRELLGMGVDKSEPEKGVYYRMDNRFPWVLDIPRLGEKAASWNYPQEMKEVTLAYPGYEDWVKDHKAIWYDSGEAEYLYKE